jgi:hypothetical protein
VSSKVEDKKTCVLDLIAKGFSGKNPSFKFGSLCSQLNVGELSSTYDEFRNSCGHRKCCNTFVIIEKGLKAVQKHKLKVQRFNVSYLSHSILHSIFCGVYF